jgi:hypothetical protein
VVANALVGGVGWKGDVEAVATVDYCDNVVLLCNPLYPHLPLELVFSVGS